MMKEKYIKASMLSIPLSALLIVGAAYPAHAEDADDDGASIVAEELMSRGMTPGSGADFSVGGSLGLAYQDNINKSSSNRKGDFVAVVNPSMRVRTDMKPYELRVDGEIEMGRYQSETENNYTDADLKARAKYHIDQETQTYVSGRYRYDHVAIGAFVDDLDSQSKEPTTYRYGEIGAGLEHDGPEWLASVGGILDFYNYDNTQRIDGTRSIQDDRDRNEGQVIARVGYKIMPDTALYVQGGGNHRNYDTQVDSTAGASRDSSGYETMVGVQYGDRKNDELLVDAAVGYLGQDYSSAGLADVGVFNYALKLDWRPEDAWRVRGDVRRAVKESSTTTSSSYLQSLAKLRTDYRLDADIQIGVAAGYKQNDFQINPLSGNPKRTDHIYEGSVYMDYLLSEQYAAGVEYTHVTRDSDQANADYSANVALARFGLRY